MPSASAAKPAVQGGTEEMVGPGNLNSLKENKFPYFNDFVVF